ncbi:antirestriction protein ArdA [Rhodanobacter sp. A1T4]|uniref:antirestriction protein ArdA n=1 Tax=Rhodanobacter sp. A1T4 TaxID=2723087 RepID=UPI0017C4D529|nr:antirestriction protein ArdA [Rhodanobacter sp. A1T4]MBB6246329.1 antirestriction protein [Rhodanobacter sp. A1T4]
MARIYVASLSDYNAGHLLGKWIDLDGKDADDVQDEIAAMLRTSKHPNVRVRCPDCEHDRDSQWCIPCGGYGTVPSAEEWAIHDYDDCPDMGENPSLEALLEQVRLIEEHGDAWEAYTECVGIKYATESGFEDARAGEADSELEWCEQFLDDCGTLSKIPENLRLYFDTERYLRDMKYGGDVSFEEVNGTVYAFWNH